MAASLFCCWMRRGRRGLRVVVAAIREETDPEINERAAADDEHHRALAVAGRTLAADRDLSARGRRAAVMAGQVKHKQIFSSIRPDWRLAKLLLNLRTRNTDMLLGAVAKVLGDEGIELIVVDRVPGAAAGPGGRADQRARRMKRSARTSSTVWAWRGRWRASTLGRRWWWRRRPAWPWRRWKAPTRPSSAPVR